MAGGSMHVETGGKKSRGAAPMDFDLNLAPIIDCFVVLIAFMLASATFLSIGILDAGIAAAGAASTEKSNPPPVNVTVELKGGNVLLVKTDGKENRSITVPAKDGKWNYDALSGHLTSIKGKWSDVSAATLIAENTVEYREVIQSMEVVRKTLPNVLLGGF